MRNPKLIPSTVLFVFYNRFHKDPCRLCEICGDFQGRWSFINHHQLINFEIRPYTQMSYLMRMIYKENSLHFVMKNKVLLCKHWLVFFHFWFIALLRFYLIWRKQQQQREINSLFNLLHKSKILSTCTKLFAIFGSTIIFFSIHSVTVFRSSIPTNILTIAVESTC